MPIGYPSVSSEMLAFHSPHKLQIAPSRAVWSLDLNWRAKNTIKDVVVELCVVKLKLKPNVSVGKIASYNKMKTNISVLVSRLIFARYWEAHLSHNTLVSVPSPSTAKILSKPVTLTHCLGKTILWALFQQFWKWYKNWRSNFASDYPYENNS